MICQAFIIRIKKMILLKEKIQVGKGKSCLKMLISFLAKFTEKILSRMDISSN